MHMQSVYLTQGTSRLGRGRHKRYSNRAVRNLEKRTVGKKGKSTKQALPSAKDLTMQIPEGCESPYHRLD